MDWVFPTPSEEKRTIYHWMGKMLEEKQCAYKNIREVQGGRVRGKPSDVQAINTEYLG